MSISVLSTYKAARLGAELDADLLIDEGGDRFETWKRHGYDN